MGSTGNSKYKILVVDDEAVVLSSTQMILKEEPVIQIVGCASGKESLDLLRDSPFQFAVILMDYRLPVVHPKGQL